MQNKNLISIIIPTLNEETTIEKCLGQFNRQSPPFEIIVVDGGSTDKTRQIVEQHNNVRLINSAAGRAIQMNAGAKIASGPILLFLHADSILPSDGLNLIRAALQDNAVIGGFFGLKHDATNLWYKILSPIINFRSAFTRIPYGDQAIFCGAAAFKHLGGYKEIPIMEDYDFAKRLSKEGKLIRLPEKVLTSFRRFRGGVVRYVLTCNLITLLYHLGVSPRFLKKLYRDIR